MSRSDKPLTYSSSGVGGAGYGGSGEPLRCETSPVPFAPLDVGMEALGGTVLRRALWDVRKTVNEEEIAAIRALRAAFPYRDLHPRHDVLGEMGGKLEPALVRAFKPVYLIYYRFLFGRRFPLWLGHFRTCCGSG